MSLRIQTTDAGIFSDESSIRTCSPTVGTSGTIAIRPPAERFFTLTSCWLPAALVSFATRSAADRRSSERRSLGRGTAVDNDTVVESNSISVPPSRGTSDRLRISEENMVKSPGAVIRANMGLYGQRG